MMRHLLICSALVLGFPVAAEELPAGAVARFGSPNLRHGERPLALALDAEGKRLASGGSDGLVKLWDTATGKLLGRFKVKDGYASSVAFSADGTLIAARFGDNLIHLIDAATMKAKRTVALPNVETVALSPDGRLVAGVTLQSSLHVYEVENGLERLQPMPGKGVAFTPNGARLVRAETGEVLRTVDVVSGETLGRWTHLSQDGVTAVAWSADGETMLSADGGPTGRVRLWRTNQEKPIAEWVASGGQATFANENVVGLNNKSVAVWDRTGKLVRTFGTNVSVLAVSGDGKVAATAGAEPHITIWNVATGRRSWTDPDDLGAVRELATAATGEIVVAAERGVAAWKPGEAAKVVLRTPASSHVVFGDNLIGSVVDRKLTIWGELPAKAPVRTIDLGPANPLAASLTRYDNGIFVSLDDKTVKQIDPETGAFVRSWETPSTIPALAVTDDRMYVAAVGRDGFARAWSLDRDPKVVPKLLWSQRVARSLRPAVAVSWNSNLVVAASIMRIDVFELRTGKRLFFGERTWQDGPFQTVAFSPDGRFVAAGSQGSAGSVLVWEVATGARVARFEGGCGSVTKLLFLQDYRLVSASVDDNLLAWDLAPRRTAPPTKAELEAAWGKLGEHSADAGFANERLLGQGGDDAWQVIAAGVNSANATGNRLRRFANDLGHPEFARREAASKGLRDLGPTAMPTLTTLAEQSADPEVVQRAEKLLDDFARKGLAKPLYGLFGDDLRMNRAVGALEQIGTPSAARLLERLHGQPGCEEARAARMRLKEKEKEKRKP